MDTWLPYFYHYGVGGAIFVVSLGLLLASGALRTSRERDRWLLAAMALGLLGFMVAHAVWIALATK